MGLSVSSLVCRRQAKLRILIFGLDAAGKTSVLYRLKLGEPLLQTIPTIGFNVESVRTEDGRATIDMWDIGGRDKIRPLFRHYFSGSHGMMFVIDSKDRERLSEALEELNRMAESLTADGLPDLPIAVLCNKSDLKSDDVANTFADVQKALELNHVLEIKHHPCRCFAVSAVTGDGLNDVIDWLVRAALHEGTEKATEPVPAVEAESKALAKAADVGWSGLYHMVKSAMLR